MKTLILIFSLLVLTCSNKTETHRHIHIRDIGWSFDIPFDFSFRDTSFDGHGRLIEQVPTDGSSLRLLVNKSEKGSFAAYVWRDTLDPKSWKNYHDNDTEWYFRQMKELPQMVVLDTKYSNEKIGGIDFSVQYAKYIKKSTSDTGYTYHYFGKIKDKGVDISFEYYDNKIGKTYHEILASSSFDN